jgi:predicted metal-binding protein
MSLLWEENIGACKVHNLKFEKPYIVSPKILFMKKVVILACENIRDQNLCVGDAKCLVAFNRREGEFARYKNEQAEIVGIVDCGGCEGNRNRVLCSLAVLNSALMGLNEKADVLHIGTCIMNYCPRKDDLLKAIKEKVGIEIVEGTHKYVPPKIFG